METPSRVEKKPKFIQEGKEERAEDIPYIKIIGGTQKERKEAKKEMVKRFVEQTEANKELEKRGIKEIEKTSEQIEAIDFLNEVTKDLLKTIIPYKNIHILEEKDYSEFFGEEKERKTLAQYVPLQQAIFIRETGSPLRFLKRLLHETITANSHQKIAISEDKNYRPEQLGILMKTREGKEFLRDLYEGIVEDFTEKFFYEKIAGNPSLPKFIQQEIYWSQERKIDLLSKIETLSKSKADSLINSLLPSKKAESLKKRFVEPSIAEIEELKGHIRDIFSVQLPSAFPRDKEEPPYELFSYEKERKIFNTLVRKLYAENSGKFTEVDDVRKLFSQSIFTGEFEWDPLVEKTFGKGTFAKLLGFDKGIEELEKLVNEL